MFFPVALVQFLRSVVCVVAALSELRLLLFESKKSEITLLVNETVDKMSGKPILLGKEPSCFIADIRCLMDFQVLQVFQAAC